MYYWNCNLNIISNAIAKRGHVANAICLITKQFLYRQRCLKNALNPFDLRHYVKGIQSMEKYIAIKNNKLSLHQSKWQNQSTAPSNTQDYVNEYIDTIM